MKIFVLYEKNKVLKFLKNTGLFLSTFLKKGEYKGEIESEQIY
jgi:hypothetical protein